MVPDPIEHKVDQIGRARLPDRRRPVV